MRALIDRLGLSSFPFLYDSGHLTRCRAESSPLRRGRVLVAGDAGGLLEPWTREGISFALRSGSAAGTFAARAALSSGNESADQALDEYVRAIYQRLVPEMDAGRRVLAVFSRHPWMVHAGLTTSAGWRVFSKFCRGELALPSLTNRPVLGMAISVMGRV